jgi:hypothetical protein
MPYTRVVFIPPPSQELIIGPLVSITFHLCRSKLWRTLLAREARETRQFDVPIKLYFKNIYIYIKKASIVYFKTGFFCPGENNKLGGSISSCEFEHDTASDRKVLGIISPPAS